MTKIKINTLLMFINMPPDFHSVVADDTFSHEIQGYCCVSFELGRTGLLECMKMELVLGTFQVFFV